MIMLIFLSMKAAVIIGNMRQYFPWGNPVPTKVSNQTSETWSHHSGVACNFTLAAAFGSREVSTSWLY